MNIEFRDFYISTYILCIFLANIISFLVFYKITKNEYSNIDLLYSFTINILGMFIGAKILFLIDNNIKFNFINFMNSGYVFIGGIVGSSLTIYLYCKIYRLNYNNLINKYVLVYPLIYSISKIGCYLQNCCFGLKYSGVFSKEILLGNKIVSVFPIQIIEAFIMFLLYLILFNINKNKKSTIIPFLLMFAMSRFIIDFMRYKRNIIIYNFTISQIICISFIICVILLYFYKSFKNNQNTNDTHTVM